MSGQDYDADLAEQQGKVGSVPLSRSLSRTASSARWRTDSPGSLPWLRVDKGAGQRYRPRTRRVYGGASLSRLPRWHGFDRRRMCFSSQRVCDAIAVRAFSNSKPKHPKDHAPPAVGSRPSVVTFLFSAGALPPSIFATSTHNLSTGQKPNKKPRVKNPAKLPFSSVTPKTVESLMSIAKRKAKSPLNRTDSTRK